MMSDSKILIPEYKIERRVRSLAHRISEEHRSYPTDAPPVMVCVLNGAFMFFTDLVKDMGIDVQIDFIGAKSYVGRDNSTGVTITKELGLDIKNKRVYVVEDIIDSGNTMERIVEYLTDLEPTNIKVVTLLQRKNTRHPADHYCFEIDNEWVVGYGLDDNSLKRNYRNIYSI